MAVSAAGTDVLPTGASTLAGVVDYAYDRKRELTDEDSTRHGGYDFGFAFDAAGNPTSFKGLSHTYNADNQLTGPESYVYDGNGNPTTWQGTALSWDPENRLLAYNNVLTAGYRGDGLRAWKQTAGGRTYFLYDGINIVCELDNDGDLLAESVFGAASLLSRGNVQYQFDPLGDAVHQLDGDGAVTANRLFDAWGNELTSGTGPHGYRAQVGYYADGESGLVALAYRCYAPGTGRFLSRDPIRYSGGVNIQAYVANRPTSSADPHGTMRPLPVGSPTGPRTTPWNCADWCWSMNSNLPWAIGGGITGAVGGVCVLKGGWGLVGGSGVGAGTGWAASYWSCKINCETCLLMGLQPPWGDSPGYDPDPVARPLPLPSDTGQPINWESWPAISGFPYLRPVAHP